MRTPARARPCSCTFRMNECMLIFSLHFSKQASILKSRQSVRNGKNWFEFSKHIEYIAFNADSVFQTDCRQIAIFLLTRGKVFAFAFAFAFTSVAGWLTLCVQIYGNSKKKREKKINTKSNKTSTLNIRSDYNRLVSIFITIDRKSAKAWEEKKRTKTTATGTATTTPTLTPTPTTATRNTYPVIMAMRINEYLPMRGNAHKFYSLLRIDSKLKVIECKKFCVMWMRNVLRKVRCKWILWIPKSKALLLTYQCTPPIQSKSERESEREKTTRKEKKSTYTAYSIS